MNEYTFQLVKMIPVVQTVTVQAECADDAFDMIEPDDSAWAPQADFDYSATEWDVEDYLPRDVDEDDEEPDAEDKPKRGRPKGSKNKDKVAPDTTTVTE